MQYLDKLQYRTMRRRLVSSLIVLMIGFVAVLYDLLLFGIIVAAVGVILIALLLPSFFREYSIRHTITEVYSMLGRVTGAKPVGAAFRMDGCMVRVRISPQTEDGSYEIEVYSSQAKVGSIFILAREESVEFAGNLDAMPAGDILRVLECVCAMISAGASLRRITYDSVSRVEA